jgi:hypothetical protein
MTNHWNDEARMTNAEGMTRPKNPNQNARSISSFGILASIVPSCFVIQISSLLFAFVFVATRKPCVHDCAA